MFTTIENVQNFANQIGAKINAEIIVLSIINFPKCYMITFTTDGLKQNEDLADFIEHGKIVLNC